MKRVTLFFFIILILVIDGCIDPFRLQQTNIPARLVVDGAITNEPGPYQVSIFYSDDIVYGTRRKYENNASVWIISDAGESELLTFLDSGVYQTNPNGIRGKMGKSYQLKITTEIGSYETRMQKMNPAGTIENLYLEFEKDGSKMLPDAKIDTRDVINMYVDAKAEVGTTNYLRWSWTGVLMGETFPKERKNFCRGVEVPDPPLCSGYIVVRNNDLLCGSTIKKIGECTCCICWGYEYNRTSLLSDNTFSHQSDFSRVPLTILPVTRMRFSNPYYFGLEQRSVSEEVYNFWKLIQDQQKASGNLFQPNSVKIRGNVHSITHPDEEILGVFEVSAINRKSIFIMPSDIPYVLEPIERQPEDCKNIIGNPGTRKPLFWPFDVECCHQDPDSLYIL